MKVSPFNYDHYLQSYSGFKNISAISTWRQQLLTHSSLILELNDLAKSLKFGTVIILIQHRKIKWYGCRFFRNSVIVPHEFWKFPFDFLWKLDNLTNYPIQLLIIQLSNYFSLCFFLKKGKMPDIHALSFANWLGLHPTFQW